MLNSVAIMGRIVRDPELRITPSGVSVCSFSVAVERNFKNSNGEKETDFFDITAWRNTADFVANHFKKGRMIVIMGRLQAETYEKDGEKRKAVKIVADSVYFGDSKPKDDSAANGDGLQLGEEIVFDDNDLPF